MLLSDAERRKFTEWLEHESLSADAIARQMEQLKSPPMVELAKRERSYVVACNIIADRLRKTESQTIDPPRGQEDK